MAEASDVPEGCCADYEGLALTYLHQARTAMEWLHPALPRDAVPAIRRYGKQGRHKAISTVQPNW